MAAVALASPATSHDARRLLLAVAWLAAWILCWVCGLVLEYLVSDFAPVLLAALFAVLAVLDSAGGPLVLPRDDPAAAAHTPPFSAAAALQQFIAGDRDSSLASSDGPPTPPDPATPPMPQFLWETNERDLGEELEWMEREREREERKTMRERGEIGRMEKVLEELQDAMREYEECVEAGWGTWEELELEELELEELELKDLEWELDLDLEGEEEEEDFCRCFGEGGGEGMGRAGE